MLIFASYKALFYFFWIGLPLAFIVSIFGLIYGIVSLFELIVD